MAGATVGQVLIDSLSTTGLIAGAVAGAPGKVGGAVAGAAKGAAQSLPGRALTGLAKKGFAGAAKSTKWFMKGHDASMKALNPMSKMGLGFPKFAKGLLGKGLGMMGINLSMSSLLRQSQLFTGIIGALFQILGGFVDVILAPFMPILSRVIQTLGEKIPIVAEWAQKGFNWLEANVFPIIRNFFGKITGKVDDVKKWFEDSWPVIQAVLGTIWESILGLKDWFMSEVWPPLKLIGDFIWEEIKSTFAWLLSDVFPILTSLWNWIKPEIADVVKWFTEDMLPLVSGYFDALRNFISGLLGTVVIAVTSLWEIVWPALKPLIQSIVGFITDVYNFISEKILPKINDFIGMIKPHLEEVAMIISDTISPIIADLDDYVIRPLWAALEPMIDLVMKIIDKFVAPVAIMLLRVVAWAITRIIWPLYKKFIDMLPEWIAAGKKWFRENVYPIIKPIIDVMIPFFQKIAAWIMEKIAAIFRWMEDIKLGFLGKPFEGLAPYAKSLEDKVDALRGDVKKQKDQQLAIELNLNQTTDGITTWSEQDKYMTNESLLARNIGIASFNTDSMSLNPAPSSTEWHS